MDLIVFIRCDCLTLVSATGSLVKVFAETDNPFRCHVPERHVRFAEPFKVFETTVPITPIPFTLRISVTLLAQHPVIVKKVWSSL